MASYRIRSNVRKLGYNEVKKTREVSEKPQSSLDGNQQQIQHSCKSKSGPDWWQAEGHYTVVCLVSDLVFDYG